MAAYLNRTVSMVTGKSSSGNNSNNTSPTSSGAPSSSNMELANALTDTTTIQRGLHHSGIDSSPLQIFVRAKKKINDIFSEIEDYVVETTRFIDDLPSEVPVVDVSEQELFTSYVLKVSNIRTVLARDHMKVAFFGRTSNGKSSVINAMLREKILPSGIGHTTHCFCQVEGIDGQEAYMVREGSDEKLNIVNLKQMANALSQEKLNESSLIRIFWPRERCNLLRDDVVFVDSPGVDVSKNLDDWIDNHCVNADVFVLVLNAESTMTLAEKSFFHTVSQRLSKPNIFVLNNRWDASASEPEFQDSVKAQHQERCIDLLVKELKVNTIKEAEERVFFVSARETLQARLKEAEGLPASAGALADGFQLRYFEFQDFEKKFEECISKSAVKTKFEQHSSRGKSIAGDMRHMLESIYERTNVLRQQKNDQKKILTDRIQNTETQLMSVTHEMKNKIHNMVEEVEQRVSKALNEEIWRLGVLVDEFSLPFHTDALVLNIYKRELNAHVEQGLGSNLKARLSSALAMNIETAQREMTERMHSLLPSDKLMAQKQVVSAGATLRQQPFEMFYSLNCQNLCSDFQERLEFRFSWGIAAIMQKLTGKGKRGAAAITGGEKKVGVPALMSPLSPGDPQQLQLDFLNATGDGSNNKIVPLSGIGSDGQLITPEQLNFISKMAIASIGSQGTIGTLIVSGILLKTVGWRFLIGVGAIYTSLYLYERLSWTNSAKEKTFKGQYVRHATSKLKLIVDLTSANCSHQVQQELSCTFAGLCRVVDQSTTDMQSELKTIEHALGKLESVQTQIKVLRNKSNYIGHELDVFEKNYIKTN